ncbi:MAG: hypothetical protein M0P71_01340 [Melioribacteraceae bacterium]|nr:hypothetical protein [Melioribacteraceae bacterium]
MSDTISVNSLSGVMSYLNSAPVANVNFYLYHSSGRSCTIVPNSFQYSLQSNPGVWINGTIHSQSETVFLSYSSGNGRSNTFYWNVLADLPITNTSVQIRFNLDDGNGVYSDYVNTDYFNIKTTLPVSTLSVSQYSNVYSLSIPVENTVDATYYKIWEGVTAPSSWTQFTSGQELISFVLAIGSEGTRTIKLQTRDNYYNLSTINSYQTFLHTVNPSDCNVNIIGTTYSDIYTGIMINSDNSMTPNREISLEFYADDLLDIDIKISGDVESSEYVDVWIPYRTSNIINFNSLNFYLVGTDYNFDQDRDITISFRDSAGNITNVVKTIRLNTKIFNCSNRLLREPSSEYDHQVMKINTLGQPEIVVKTQTLENTYTRLWDDIFYPTTHSYPLNVYGEFDEATAKTMNGVSNADYDAVQLSSGNVVYDEEGRPKTVDWTNDGSKNYSNLESSYSSGLKYWILSNPSAAEIKLNFEFFYLNANSYGPPYNNLSPYYGDCLVLYDASAEGATREIILNNGEKTYEILDSTKLVEIYAYTGSGNQVMELSSGYLVSADTYGAFSTPTISGKEKLCLIFYSDAAGTGSGFKLKSSEKQDITFKNYDIDEKNGELWLHTYPDGISYENDIRMIYDYYDTEVDIGYDDGSVSFSIMPSGVISADYTYYKKQEDITEEERTRMFILGNDDLVDYYDPNIFITPSGEMIDKVSTWDFSSFESGKLVSNFSIDKDRGVLEFYSGVGYGFDEFYFVPIDCRVTSDYNYHTYKRLSNDGYGSLSFRDSTIVADNTTVYPDYTWNDVKIVNEGNAILEGGQITFTMRGYDTNSDGTIDQVLDVNRPWDIQEGTPDETYNKVAMEVRSNYTFSLKPTRTEARTILSNWKNQPFGFDVSPRSRFYGRVCYVLCGTSGNDYPSATSVGSKTFSSEISGKFYSIDQ